MKSRYRCLRMIRRAICCSLLLGLGACTPKVYYQPPSGLMKEGAASIVGTRLQTGPLLADRRFFIAAVDAVEVEDADAYSESRLSIPNGRRVLLARFEQASLSAEADFVLDVEPQQSLLLSGRVLEENFLGHARKVGFSILDEKLGIPLSPEIVKEVQMSQITTVPVYIPR